MRAHARCLARGLDSVYTQDALPVSAPRAAHPANDQPGWHDLQRKQKEATFAPLCADSLLVDRGLASSGFKSGRNKEDRPDIPRLPTSFPALLRPWPGAGDGHLSSGLPLISHCDGGVKSQFPTSYEQVTAEHGINGRPGHGSGHEGVSSSSTGCCGGSRPDGALPSHPRP